MDNIDIIESTQEVSELVFLYVLLGAGALLLLISFVCFYITFYNPKRTPEGMEADRLPPGKAYEPYHEVMNGWHEETQAMSREEWEITSADGLTLRGRYYELTPDAPVEILFHGYRGFSERDMCGAVQRSFAVGHSALLVDLRCHGRSDGHIITFGLRESEDVPLWIEEVRRRFGADHPVMISGVSMGAATVMMATGLDLPANVKAVLADCGYTSAKAIIQKVIRRLKLPAFVYLFIRVGAVIYGGFDPDKADATAALRRCKVPVIFYHGDSDGFVPCEMSRENYAACAAPKMLVITDGADHGLCYPADTVRYVEQLKTFMAENDIP